MVVIIKKYSGAIINGICYHIVLYCIFICERTISKFMQVYGNKDPWIVYQWINLYHQVSSESGNIIGIINAQLQG